MSRKALFLDRDGTINIDRVYINDPQLLELIPRSGEAIAFAQQQGFRIIVVTNQSGVGRGLIRAEVLPLIHQRLDELLKEHGASIDEYKFCIHRPEDGCACRKPGTVLLEEAIQKWQLDPKNSFFIGDSWSDIQAGKRAGCKSILVRTGKGIETEKNLQFNKTLRTEQPEAIVDDLWRAVQWVCNISSNSD